MTSVISAPLRANLFSLLKTQAQIDSTQQRLATGRRVNSALDDPNAFFSSFALLNRSRDLNTLLDNVGQSIQTIQAADAGLKAITNLLEQAEAITNEVIARKAFSPSQSLTAQILDANPVGYWRLNETAGNTATNLGSAGGAINGQYQSGVTLGAPALYNNGGDLSASFDGSNDRVRIPNSNQINQGSHARRTIELVFNANDINSRQVLYEEGGTLNALSIYIENGSVYVNGRDQNDWGPFDINVPITQGQTHHVALVLDQPNSEFRGYLDGELMGTGAVTVPLSSHTGGIGIGRLNGATFFHDGSQSGNGAAFNGRIGEVALYNDVLTQEELQSHSNALNPSNVDLQFARDLEELKNQIDQIAQDSSYRGVNLLQNDTLSTFFNERRTSSLDISGGDFTTAGLYLDNTSFENESEAQLTLAAIKSALGEVRRFNGSLATDRSVLSIRNTHLNETINILEEGSDKLTLADMNEEGAKMLALATSRQMGIASLSATSFAQNNILSLFENLQAI